jgi:hypothetical protein
MKPCTALVLLPLLAALAACSSSSNDTTTPDAGTPPPPPNPPPAALTVAPATADVLSCGTSKFAASQSGAAPAGVTWTSSDGTIDADGTFHAPTHALASAATITAHVGADSANASANVATAFPHAPTAIAGSSGAVAGVFDHAAAAKGKRVYTAWATKPSAGSVGISFARSDDGGATFAAAKSAVTTNVSVSGAVPAMDCVSVAIDAANADVVYIAGHVNVDNDIIHAATPAAKDQTVFLLVSEDGGGTWKTYPMWGGQSANGPLGGWDSPVICPDVVSPAANAVVVATPGGGDVCAGSPDIAIWADAARGAGFASGVGDGSNADFVANGTTRALDRIDGTSACPDNGHIEVLANGGTDFTGGTTESPRLFADGAGHACTTFIGGVSDGGPVGGGTEHAYVMCSDATAATFTRIVLDPSDGNRYHTTAVGGFGPNGRAAVAWATSNGTNDEKLFVAISKDSGATWSAPIQVKGYAPPGDTGPGTRTPAIAWDASGVLWIAYEPYDGGAERLVVDKTCDDGASFSGPVLVNGPEGSVANARFPVLLATGDAAPALLSHVDASLQITRLAP